MADYSLAQSTAFVPSQDQYPSDARSPSSTTATSEASTSVASPSLSFMVGEDLAVKLQRNDRTSSVGSSDCDELRDAQVQPFPADHKATDMPRLELNEDATEDWTRLLSFRGVLSPRQESGKRYYGSYLLHRVPIAAGLLKSWKRRYFRLRGHGLVCYSTQDATTPLFEVLFTTQSVLIENKAPVERMSSIKTLSRTTGQSSKASMTYPDSLEKHRQRITSDSLTLTLYHTEATKAVEVPMILKAENDDDYVAWTECLPRMIEARKRTLLQVSNIKNDLNEVPSPAQAQPCDSTLSHPKSRPDNEKDCQDDGRLAQIETFEAFSAKYMLMKEIGEGTFSIVHRAVNRLTGQMRAVKCCKTSQALEEEERLLRTFSHPNVVHLEGVYERDATLHYVVMDYLKDGDLCDLLIERQRLTETEARRIIRQVVEGLAYLHRRCVLHRDIKPENLLIHGNLVKIADFGLAIELAQSTTMLTHSCGTLEYAAPELLCGRPYGLKSDVFSLGIVLYVLLFGAFPFSVESAAALQREKHCLIRDDVRDMSCLSRSNVQWRSVSPLAQDVLLKMLEVNEADRISTNDLLRHPWFNETANDMLGMVESESTPEELDRVRIEDCEALGFAELLSRGFQVVKYGFNNSTQPHPSTLTVNFMEESITWSPRINSTLMQTSTSGSNKRGRVIMLREIREIREGHTTEAFTACKHLNFMPPPELCLSVICSWRTLDIVVKAPSQREFMVRGLQRLLGIAVQ